MRVGKQFEHGPFYPQINIETLEIIKGKLPHGATVLVKEWGLAHLAS